MISHITIFVIAMAFLAKGADYFVEYSGRIAKRLGVSDFVIGLTITSIGTSLPELASSISAVLEDRPGLVIGNVVGSNIANIGLVLGISAIIRSFKTERRMHDRDGYIMLASVILFFFYSLDNEISFLEALSFIGLYALYMLFILKVESSEIEVQFRDFMRFVFDFEYTEPLRRRVLELAAGKPAPPPGLPAQEGVRRPDLGAIAWESLVVVLSALAIVGGAKYVVVEAVWAAGVFGVPDNIIGLSMIAVGTSLPELLVSISAVRKNRGGILVGNIIGSNIANLFLIVGVCGLIRPISVEEFSVVYTVPIMLFFSLAFMYFIRSDWEIRRIQGGIAVFAYAVFITAAFVMDWS